MINLVKMLCCTEEKMLLINLFKGIFREYCYWRYVMKKNFNKNLVMSAEQNEEFERSNIC